MNRTDNATYLQSKPVGDGWMPIITELDEQIEALTPGYSIVQAKEKFGGLRFYIELPTDDDGNQGCSDAEREQVHALIGAAEARCAVTCEECGAPGEPRKGSWLRTLCDEHAAEPAPAS